jgi:hypothetical protein
MMSIWLADVNGRVVKAIVNKDLKMFLKRVSNCHTSPIIDTDFCVVPIFTALISCKLSDRLREQVDGVAVQRPLDNSLP